jgi:hypothetical protein
MKLIKQILRRTVMAVTLTLLPASAILAQTNLQFTGITQMPEQSIQIRWVSMSNETYEIDEADALATNADGSTQWNQLYTGYPSQGTNTFWLDTGNYYTTPAIVNPKYSPVRFYRVVDLGPDTTSDEPTATVTSPTNGNVVSDLLTVTVSATTDQSFLATTLYVDGQTMNPPDVHTNSASGGTNYVTDTYYLNTCEWLNGPHTLFASAQCQSGAAGAHDVPVILIGHGVSPYVSVNFSNLITGISFTQPFFAPEDGTLQEVTAVFAANVDWTLQIQDVNTNTVRTTTGSGGTMLFDWDGKDDGGTNLPVGTYTYLITVETNGLALPAGGGGSGGGSGGVPSPSFASSASRRESVPTQLWAQHSDGSGAAVPFILYPPGFDTNDLTIFEAPVTFGVEQSISAVRADSSRVLVSGGESEASPAYSGGSSQSSRAPLRPPTKPVRGRAGTYGVAYDTYGANGTNGFTLSPPHNGMGLGLVQLEGHTSSTSTFHYAPLKSYQTEVQNFILQMWAANWSQGFVKVDDQFSVSSLTGAGSIFNNVELGLLFSHGTYGTSMDFSENGAQEVYLPITSGQGSQYLRMSDLSLGSSATNGLKWMGILACNSMRQSQWNSMRSAHNLPFNSNLHLILGANSIISTGDHVASYWAEYITLGPDIGQPPMLIESAWYAGARAAYAESGYTYSNTMFFAASGDANCRNDLLQTNASPSGTYFYNSTQVWP